MARDVVKETTINGCPFKPGEMVLLSFPAANRDPAMFPDADRVVIDRKEIAMRRSGLGIHRCIGSNLARMEIAVALQEWLPRIPDFRLDPAADGDMVGGHGARTAPAAASVRLSCRAARLI
jgi:cytochrome P450